MDPVALLARFSPFVSPLVLLVQAAPATSMSLATNLTSMMEGRHYEVALSVPMGDGWTTTQFCSVLEKAVGFMQSGAPQMVASLFKSQKDADTFLRLVLRYVPDEFRFVVPLFRASHLCLPLPSSISSGHVYMVACVSA